MSDPLSLLADDRARARAERDPWSDLCVLATFSGSRPAARTLVLREVAGRPAVFTNATSPKHAHFSLVPQVAVLVYLASIGVQWRLDAVLEPIATEIVHGHWRARPRIPKVMDWLYREHVAQSTPVESRAVLEGLHDDVHRRLGDDPEAPHEAAGHFIVPSALERLELARDTIHDRVRFRRERDAWIRETLVP